MESVGRALKCSREVELHGKRWKGSQVCERVELHGKRWKNSQVCQRVPTLRYMAKGRRLDEGGQQATRAMPIYHAYMRRPRCAKGSRVSVR